MTFDPLRLRIIWNNETPVTPYMGFRDLHVMPEPEYPFGRKGLGIARAWEEIGIPNEAVGLLILDGDVAIDPNDIREMHEHIWSEPGSVWVAPVRIWPISHLGSSWTWGHGKDGEFSQTDHENPNMFAFCFTYLPARLVDLANQQHGLREWCYPNVDMFMWELAQQHNIKVDVARNCQPKHMHW